MSTGIDDVIELGVEDWDGFGINNDCFSGPELCLVDNCLILLQLKPLKKKKKLVRNLFCLG